MAPVVQKLLACGVLLILASAPAQAEDACECEQDPGGVPEGGNGTSHPEQHQCQVVDYSVSRPTALVVDPDRCFVPYILNKVPI